VSGTVRSATSGDVPALVLLINRAYQVEKFFVVGERTSDAEIRERMARPGAAFLVIDAFAADAHPHRDTDQTSRGAEAALAGAVFVQVKGDRGYLAMLSVDPARQRRGLGRVLMAAAERHCRSGGCRFLDLDIVNVREELPAFYARFGYAPFDTAPFHDPAKLTRPAHLVLMTKPLVDIWS
jgi:GNAT superfamily N-acetyltransferase